MEIAREKRAKPSYRVVTNDNYRVNETVSIWSRFSTAWFSAKVGVFVVLKIFFSRTSVEPNLCSVTKYSIIRV